MDASGLELNFDKARDKDLVQAHNAYCSAVNLSENAEYQEHGVKSFKTMKKQPTDQQLSQAI